MKMSEPDALLISRVSVLTLVAVLATGSARAQPRVTVSPSSHNYGSVDVGKAKDRGFRISNTGSDTLRGIASLFAEVHFTISVQDSFAIQPGGFLDVTVTFAPLRPGEQFDSLLVAHNAVNAESPVSVPLRGVGVPRPEVSVIPLEYDFDTVAVRTSEETIFWVGNPGSGQLTARASIAFGSPNYEVTSTTELFLVPAGDSMPVVVQYAPRQVTMHTGRLRIDHNGVNESTPINVTLTGVGAQAVTIDRYEPNDTAGSAIQIDPGFVSDSTEIWPNGDVDYFRFQGVYREWISISVEVTPGSTLNSKVWLFDSSGNLIAENDNYEGSNDHSQIDDTLNASGTYYIRVAFAANNEDFPNEALAKAFGEDPIGEYRLSLSRTGFDPLGTPSLVSPKDSVFNERVNPTLVWTPVDGARIYDVAVASSEDFSPESVVFQSTRTDTSVIATDLPAGTVLFWKVRAGYELGPGEFSEVQLFQTTFPPVVVSQLPDILLPEDSETIDLRPVFSDPEGGALTYRAVSLSDSSVVDAIVTGSSLTVSQIGSGASVVTVGATDPKGAETTTSFGVIAGEATSNEQEGGPQEDFRIGINYPNPFHGETMLPFTLSESAEVTLRLFDLLGNEIQTVFDGKLAGGHHHVELSAADLAPGIYLIRLEAGDRRALSSIVVGY